MKRIFAIVLLSLVTLISHAQTPISDTTFDFRLITISQATQLFYEAVKRPYIITADVLKDDRLTSYRTGSVKPDAFLDLILEQYGFERQRASGMDVIRKKNINDADKITMVITPKHRTPNYISGLIQPLTEGKFSSSRVIKTSEQAPSQNTPAGSAAAMIEQSADVLVFTGTKSDIDRIQALIPQLDTPQGEVIVKSVIYQVSSGKTEGNAFQLLGSILSGKLGVSAGASSLGDAITFKIGDMSAVISALSSDNRFKVLSRPSMRLTSGAKGKFSVGDSTPTLGSTSTATGGQVVQSVTYQQSGLILEVSPTVRQKDIELKVKQQLSNFVKTENGVNNSPTLVKREIESALTLEDGEMVVIGSLNESKDSATAKGLSFLPAWMQAKGSDSTQSELLLLLQVQRVKPI
jgi:type II secretory pathway component GspD/PulD (secretin)